MPTIDLHIHSSFSDGTYSPSEIVTLAAQLGLSTIALTDHDTVAGVLPCQAAAEQLGIQVISGIELSTRWGQLELHLLGYHFDPHHPQLLNYLETLKEARMIRTHQILSKLQDCGVDLTFSDVTGDCSSECIVTRAHFANALLSKGYIDYQKQAFERYLGEGKPAFVAKESLLSTDEAISLIHSAGGVAVLAHPTLYRMNRNRTYSLIYQLLDVGLDGLECYYPSYTPRQSKDFIDICKKHHLISTGGSDFHGASKPQIALGQGYGHLEVPSSILETFTLRQSSFVQ